MIECSDKTFRLLTDHTAYLFRVTPFGHVEHLHYGGPVPMADGAAMATKTTIARGSSVMYDESSDTYCLDDMALEWSGVGKGDFRNPPAELTLPDGTFTNDFVYESHELLSGPLPMATLPTAYGDDAQTLILHMKEKVAPVSLDLIYTVYAHADVITRRAVLKNQGNAPMVIDKLMSYMLDMMPAFDLTFTTFDGGWIREARRHDRPVASGIYVNEGSTGASGHKHNPGVLLSEKHCSEEQGRCWGFNLLYSGNHYTAVEKSENGLVRVMAGVSPRCFRYTLAPGASFETPEGVMTYSDGGFNGLSAHFHDFINQHVIRGDWKGKERPVLCNDWEACFFSFRERKLLSLAKRAKKAGAELFVLDDGWFQGRNDDKGGLGDYTVDRKKLPHGLEGLCAKINRLGMSFGLWMEPESVNENSDLYRAHPDWAVKLPNRKPSYGRNQLLLDLVNPAVRDYIVENVGRILDSASITYVKWDMNRHMSDMYSPFCENGAFFHEYIKGLYDVLGRIFYPRPHILFESCSSGGNRFDLGMLCYSQQIWASDDTDAIERVKIQGGLSYLYPVSSMGAHISEAPHQQTLRDTPLSTRFHTSAFGALGWEMDLGTLTYAEKKEAQKEMEFYKAHRSTFQFGRFSRLGRQSGMETWVARGEKEAMAARFLMDNEAAAPNDVLRVPGLEQDRTYTVERQTKGVRVGPLASLLKHVAPVSVKKGGFIIRTIDRFFMLPDGEEKFTATGRALAEGVPLNTRFIGTGYNKDIRMLSDFGSELYYIRPAEEA